MSNHLVTSLAALLLTVFFSSSAHAEFDLPDYVHTASQLNEAQEKAKSSGQPITFVGSNKESTCPLTTAASKEVFAGLQEQSTVVYVEHSDLNSLPEAVSNALDSEEAGRYLPKTVVLNADMDTVIAILPYAEAEQRVARIKEAQEKIAAYQRGNR
jgi:hypothetical protein